MKCVFFQTEIHVILKNYYTDGHIFMKKTGLFLLFAMSFLWYACSPVRTVVPLQKQEKHITASFGGPLIRFSGLIIPVPLTSVSASYGISDHYTLNAGLHATSLAFGVIQTEASVTANILKVNDSKWGVSTTPGFYFMTDVWKWKSSFYPFIDVNVYRHYGEKSHFMYLSLTSLFELSSVKAFDQEISGRYIPTVTFGHTWNKEKMNYTLEMKYMGFTQDNQNIVVEYVSPASKGAFGLQFGITRKF